MKFCSYLVLLLGITALSSCEKKKVKITRNDMGSFSVKRGLTWESIAYPRATLITDISIPS